MLAAHRDRNHADDRRVTVECSDSMRPGYCDRPVKK
jgi:hypothetical protein